MDHTSKIRAIMIAMYDLLIFENALPQNLTHKEYQEQVKEKTEELATRALSEIDGVEQLS